MKFANPQFFWALFSLALPILIHLFHFRRFKTVYFTNVRFLRELKKETSSRSRLRHLLILISRCLALSALIFAFAQPFIPTAFSSQKGDRVVSFYLDNSFSMDARAESSSLMELASKHILEIAKTYKSTDRFQLITNDLESRELQWLTLDQLTERLEENKTSVRVQQLGKIILRQQESIKETSKPGEIYILSDFQRNSSSFNETKADTAIAVHFLPIRSSSNENVSLDSVWFENPYRDLSQPDQLAFGLSNFSSITIENYPIKLSLDGSERGIETIRAGSDSSLKTQITYSSPGKGKHAGEIRITDYPVSFDDVFYFSYQVPEKIKILLINGKESNPFLNQLYRNNASFSVTESSQNTVDFSSIPTHQLVILNELTLVSTGLVLELEKFVSIGGSLVILPSLSTSPEILNPLTASVQAATYNSISQAGQKVGNLNLNHPIYNDIFERRQESIDLPSVLSYAAFSGGNTQSQDQLMVLQNGQSFLSAFGHGQGKVYCSAVPLNEQASNFPKHAIFIPTFYKIALYSLPSSKLYYTIGREEPIELKTSNIASEVPIKIRSLDKKTEVIPERRILDGNYQLFVRGSIQSAGNYEIIQGDSVLQLASFNYDRSESNPSRLKDDELRTKMDEAGYSKATITDASANELPAEMLLSESGQSLWKLFVLLALMFLAIEVLLIRFLK